MTPPNRTPEETNQLRVLNLERRVQALERTGAGHASMEASQSGSIVVAATASPGTTLTGATLTITRPGRYLCVAVFDFVGSVTGWSLGLGVVMVNGAETVDGRRALFGDSGAASSRASVSVVKMLNLNAADVIALAAFKNAAGGTLTAGGPTTTLDIAWMAPL